MIFVAGAVMASGTHFWASPSFPGDHHHLGTQMLRNSNPLASPAFVHRIWNSICMRCCHVFNLGLFTSLSSYDLLASRTR